MKRVLGLLCLAGLGLALGVPSGAAPNDIGFGQTVVYLAHGYRLEGEAFTHLGNPYQQPSGCISVRLQQFGTPYSIGVPTDTFPPASSGNCWEAHYSIPQGYIAGVLGTIQCDSEQGYICNAELREENTGTKRVLD